MQMEIDFPAGFYQDLAAYAAPLGLSPQEAVKEAARKWLEDAMDYAAGMEALAEVRAGGKTYSLEEIKLKYSDDLED